MSRSGYTDDPENLAMWRGMVASSIRGRRGQQLLRELAAAMDAMPEKILIAHALKDGDGAYCALGVVGAARGIDLSKIDTEDPAQLSKAFNIAECLAQEIEFINDDDWNYGETPEHRWRRVRQWVAEQIKEGTLMLPADKSRFTKYHGELPANSSLRGLDLIVLHAFNVDGDTHILVIGDPEQGWYEWAFDKDGTVSQHSDLQYGNVAGALRDGLIEFWGCPELERARHQLAKIDKTLDELGAPKDSLFPDEFGKTRCALSRRGRIRKLVTPSSDERSRIIEECADVADQNLDIYSGTDYTYRGDVAEKIRALKNPEQHRSAPVAESPCHGQEAVEAGVATSRGPAVPDSAARPQGVVAQFGSGISEADPGDHPADAAPAPRPEDYGHGFGGMLETVGPAPRPEDVRVQQHALMDLWDMAVKGKDYPLLEAAAKSINALLILQAKENGEQFAEIERLRDASSAIGERLPEADLYEIEEAFSALTTALDHVPDGSFTRNFIETRRERLQRLVKKLRAAPSSVAQHKDHHLSRYTEGAEWRCTCGWQGNSVADVEQHFGYPMSLVARSASTRISKED